MDKVASLRVRQPRQEGFFCISCSVDDQNKMVEATIGERFKATPSINRKYSGS